MLQRILILARDMVGDLVNTTGAVQRLREHFPEAEFVLEGGPAALELFPDLEVWVRKRHPGILGKLRRVLAYRHGRFDRAIVLDDSREKIRLAVAAGIPSVVGSARDVSPIGRAVIVPTDEGGHDLFDPLRLILRSIGASDDVVPKLPITPEHRLRAEEYAGRGEILLHVGSSDTAKSWPDESWIELARRLGADCVVGAGPGEESVRGRVAIASGATPMTSMGLLDYAAVIERMHAIVSSDTSAAHLAGAVGTPSVVLYGPTDPARFHPWSHSVAVRRDSTCAHYGHGCAHRREGTCSQTCMSAISVDDVVGALSKPVD